MNNDDKADNVYYYVIIQSKNAHYIFIKLIITVMIIPSLVLILHTYEANRYEIRHILQSFISSLI